MMGVGKGHEFNLRPILFKVLRDVSVYISTLLILSSLVTFCQVELGRI